jgi:uncharacterized protein YggU (UPF0235/DUF167 family)
MKPSPARPWQTASGGLTLAVRATPKGGRDAIDGIELLADGRAVLKIRVRAAPADGEANAALVAVIAKSAGIPRSTITLVRGASGRIKVFRLAGDPGTLAAALERMVHKHALSGDHHSKNG